MSQSHEGDIFIPNQGHYEGAKKDPYDLNLREYIESKAPSGGSGYLVYTALISQSGTNELAIIKEEKTVGTPQITRVNAGRFNIQFTDINIGTSDDIKKIWVGGMAITNFSGGSGAIPLLATDNKPAANIVFTYAGAPPSGNSPLQILMFVYDLNGNEIELSTVIGGSEIWLPEIRYYNS